MNTEPVLGLSPGIRGSRQLPPHQEGPTHHHRHRCPRALPHRHPAEKRGLASPYTCLQDVTVSELDIVVSELVQGVLLIINIKSYSRGGAWDDLGPNTCS